MRGSCAYPLKLVWYARYPAELYDLSSDRRSSAILAPMRPRVAVLTAELGAWPSREVAASGAGWGVRREARRRKFARGCVRSGTWATLLIR